MSVGSRDPVKQVTLELKQVVKLVTVLFTVAKQKTMKKKMRRVKDGRVIAPRKTASTGRDKKEQLWKVKDLDRAFDLREKKKDLSPTGRWSKETGIPYTTLCERLSGRREGGKRGKIAGGKHTARVLRASKFKWVIFRNGNGSQAGNHSSPHNDTPLSFISLK